MSLARLRALGQNNRNRGLPEMVQEDPYNPINLSSPRQLLLALKDPSAFNATVPVYNFSLLGPPTLNKSPSSHYEITRAKIAPQSVTSGSSLGLSPALPLAPRPDSPPPPVVSLVCT